MYKSLRMIGLALAVACAGLMAAPAAMASESVLIGESVSASISDGMAHGAALVIGAEHDLATSAVASPGIAIVKTDVCRFMRRDAAPGREGALMSNAVAGTRLNPSAAPGLS